jgi:D-glycero-D-manno-heptose 1,7-bisphosphate phosphatase
MQHRSEIISTLPPTDKSWTLFLDRDGVINKDVVDDYVKSWEEFHFCEGSLQALQILAPLFCRIVVVSNQRGVGKGIMQQEMLNLITNNMLLKIEEAGGRIDAVYYCTSVDPHDPNRKPNRGMALQAKSEFPEIDFNKSIMVGNMPGDMWFGKNMGAYTVYTPTRENEFPEPHTVDARYKNLLAFAEDLYRLRNVR